MTGIDRIVSELPTITLEELLEVAALLNRTDRKYVVTADQFGALVAELTGDIRVLTLNGGRTFRYESMYFDTAERDSYRAAAHRRRHRFKVRTRSYVESADTYLEVKVRDARRRTVKVRTPYAFANRSTLTAEARAFVAGVFADHGIDAALVDGLVPTLHTEFRRTTVLVPSAGCRMTVDTDLTLSQPGGASRTIPDLIILETKSDAQDRRVDRALWRMGIRPQSVSKFAIGSALLDPALPSNKWSRTMNRHFDVAED